MSSEIEEESLMTGGGANGDPVGVENFHGIPWIDLIRNACTGMYEWTEPCRQGLLAFSVKYWWSYFIFAVLILFLYWRLVFAMRVPPEDPPGFLAFRSDIGDGYHVSPTQENMRNALGLLKNASMEDNTVILTTLNEAWAAPNSVFDLFLESFKNSKETSRLLKHLVVVCLDQQALSRCTEVHSHCLDFTNGVNLSKEARFDTPDYLNMMWKRLEFQRSVLELGYNFLYTDADIMWFRDPFSHFDPDSDFQIASDVFNSNRYDKSNLPDGGFKFVRSNSQTIQFYNFWYASREKYPGFYDQEVLNQIKYNPKITEIGLKMNFLDTTYFGGFCQVSKDLDKVHTMHANCCAGLENKLHDLRLLLDDWKRYLSMKKSWKPNPNGSSPWRVPQKCNVPLPSGHLHDTL